LSNCENDLEYFIAVNTFGKTPAPGSFSSISCQQAFSPTSSGSNFKGEDVDFDNYSDYNDDRVDIKSY
jgi:hypothetical protein